MALKRVPSTLNVNFGTVFFQDTEVDGDQSQGQIPFHTNILEI